MSAPAPLLSCPLFPPLSWWMEAISHGPRISLYTGMSARKGVYRNRYRIVSANGPLLLSIPLKGGRRQHASLEETLIDYTHAWQRQHWGALFSAYGRSPYFGQYGPELKALLFAGHSTLLHFNLASIEWLAGMMKLDLSVGPGTAGAGETAPLPEREWEIPPYHQVFEDRFGFLSDMSAIDLLMAEGPYAGALLRSAVRERS